MIRTLLLLFLPFAAEAATFYVATDGNDANPGSSSAPWRTIQKAANTVSAGDIVIVRAGIYFERVTFPTSGTASNPITFRGMRTGETWNTIVDGSSSTSGWTIAGTSSDGHNYYSASLGSTVGFMSTNSQMMMRIHHQSTHPITGDGFDVLSWPDDFIYGGSNSNQTTPDPVFWDVFQGVWGRHTNSLTYIRFRFGETPANMNVRIAPENSAVFDISSNNYLIFEDLHVRNSTRGFWVRGGSTNITIQNCFVGASEDRIRVEGGADDIIIRDNEITGNFYGNQDVGAWDPSSSPIYIHSLGEASYRFLKYWWSPNEGSPEHAILVDNCAQILIEGNLIYNGRGGVDMGDVSSLTMRNNTITDMTSTGVLVWCDVPGTFFIHDNYFDNSNINLRLHHVDGGTTNTIVYIYRNRFNLYWRTSTHIFFHSSVTGATCLPQIFIYHNSLSGSDNNCYHGNSNLMVNTLVVNNISSARHFWTAASTVYSNTNGIDGYDYNWYTGFYSSGEPVWLGPNNFDHATGGDPPISSYIWDPRTDVDFVLPIGHEAIDAAIDISQSFVIQGKTYGALPGFTSGWWSGSGPDIGAIEGGLPGAGAKKKIIINVVH